MTLPLPSLLIESLNVTEGFDEHSFREAHRSGEQLTSIRINPFKPADIFADAEAVAWCPLGKYLAQRPSFIADPLFHAGCYYVQEASSMFLEQVLTQAVDLDERLRVLDLCASPGGKSTHLASLISADSLLVSNEIIKNRVLTLADNLSKWGSINTVVTNNDPSDFRRTPGFFDVLVVDAPCSGSGMFRKDPETIREWSENAVELCSQRQKRILADVYPALKEDGILIYATCSYSPDENEVIADWLCETFGMEPVVIETDPSWGIVVTESEKSGCRGFRFYPHLTKGEGLFMTCLRKKTSEKTVQFQRMKDGKIGRNDLEMLHGMIEPGTDVRMIHAGDQFSAIRPEHDAEVAYLQSNLYLKKSGVRLGRIAGRDFVPDHELALSLICRHDVPKVEVSLDQAIAYLRKDELDPVLAAGKTGWARMAYRNYALGWAKLLPNRINNYYPKGLRILKDI